MLSEKKGIRQIVDSCVKKGVVKVVISPGSRNAPLTISFGNHPEVSCYSVVDERSAAFIALGMAQQLKQPVALLCTSGSASLNYAPAIAEAYYQKIPLLVLTADRPDEWTDQADGQTINQKNIYQNYIKGSYHLPQEPNRDNELWYNSRLLSEAINTTTYPDFGPVHVNVPIEEPLYRKTEEKLTSKIISTVATDQKIAIESLSELVDLWNNSSRKLILAGVLAQNEQLNKLLSELANDPSLTVLTETTSNLIDSKFNGCIDRLVMPMSEAEEEEFKPEILVTFGGQVVSKKIKNFLRSNKPLEHWHIDVGDLHLDTYQSLTRNIPVSPVQFFEQFLSFVKPFSSDFSKKWKRKDIEMRQKHQAFLGKAPYSDLKVFEHILKAIPGKSNLQVANSTPIRYVQLFDLDTPLFYNANRGTSGIDGTVSTAVGACLASGKKTTVITGDLSFFYDSNALWNNYLPDQLKIILINNSGGGIFRIIPGPDQTNQLEKHFEAKHDTKAEFIAKAFDVEYFSCTRMEDLDSKLEEFYKHNNVAILEIHTPNEINAEVLKAYWQHLKTK